MCFFTFVFQHWLAFSLDIGPKTNQQINGENTRTENKPNKSCTIWSINIGIIYITLLISNSFIICLAYLIRFVFQDNQQTKFGNLSNKINTNLFIELLFEMTGSWTLNIVNLIEFPLIIIFFSQFKKKEE